MFTHSPTAVLVQGNKVSMAYYIVIYLQYTIYIPPPILLLEMPDSMHLLPSAVDQETARARPMLRARNRAHACFAGPPCFRAGKDARVLAILSRKKYNLNGKVP